MKCEYGLHAKPLEVSPFYCDLAMECIFILQPGFTGKYCNDNLDECSAKPCLNNASCSPGNNDFRCACPPGRSLTEHAQI